MRILFYFISHPSMLGKLCPTSTKSFHDMVALAWTERKLKARSFQEGGSDLAQAQLSKCQSQPWSYLWHQIQPDYKAKSIFSTHKSNKHHHIPYTVVASFETIQECATRLLSRNSAHQIKKFSGINKVLLFAESIVKVTKVLLKFIPKLKLAACLQSIL